MSQPEILTLMEFYSDVDYNDLQRVLMWMIIIFDVDRYDTYGRLCIYLTLLICIFDLKLPPIMHMCFNYLKFDLLLNYLYFRFREYIH